MASSMFSRIWRRIRSPTGYVGKDLDGNRYYEHINPISGGRTRRVVKYRRGVEVWEHVSGMRRLPAQWTAWLSHTRKHHPTIKELTADVARIESTRRNAALLEEKVAEERAQLFFLHKPQATDSSGVLPSQAITQPADERVNPGSISNQELRKRFAKEQMHKPQKDLPVWRPDKEETEGWTPKAARRRG